MKQTTLCFEEKTFNLFSDLQHEFNKLNTTRQSKFVKRVGFNPKEYKTFMSSSLDVCVYLGLRLGDLKWEHGRLVINIDNLNKREVNKEYIALPLNFSSLFLGE